MGVQRIPTRVNGQIIDESWFNAITRAMLDFLVPRTGQGEVGSLAGSLGTPSLRFLKAFISEGYWQLGDYKLHHSFNSLVSAGEGWMLCDGRQINQTNYDAEHGAGAWAAFIQSTSIDGNYLPDFSNRFLAGTASTTQDGSSPIAAVGNSGSVVNLEHLHNLYIDNGPSNTDSVHDSSGNSGLLSLAPAKSFGLFKGLMTDPTRNQISMYTQKQGNAAQSIKPDSIAVQVYMRIV